MGYARPSRTEEIFGELQSGPNGRILVDSLGLIHWYEPRNATDARPWTNSHLTRPLSRTLRTVDGPRWAELWKLAEALGATPRKARDGSGNETWGAPHTSGDWGFQATRWRYGNDGPRWRATVAMAHINYLDEDERVDRQNLRDTNPSEVLTWAARLGILGDILIRFRNGTRVQTGEVARPQLVVEL
jgi:hypothetical protein